MVLSSFRLTFCVSQLNEGTIIRNLIENALTNLPRFDIVMIIYREEERKVKKSVAPGRRMFEHANVDSSNNYMRAPIGSFQEEY